MGGRARRTRRRENPSLYLRRVSSEMNPWRTVGLFDLPSATASASAGEGRERPGFRTVRLMPPEGAPCDPSVKTGPIGSGKYSNPSVKNGRGDWIRTSDPSFSRRDTL
jgi:hypothetical protein